MSHSDLEKKEYEVLKIFDGMRLSDVRKVLKQIEEHSIYSYGFLETPERFERECNPYEPIKPKNLNDYNDYTGPKAKKPNDPKEE